MSALVDVSISEADKELFAVDPEDEIETGSKVGTESVDAVVLLDPTHPLRGPL